MKYQEHRTCSFCGKLKSETCRVLPGPGLDLMICEECVALSEKILRKPVPTGQMDGKCSFCGKASSQIERLVFGPRTNICICNRCIAFAHQQLDSNDPTGTSGPGALRRRWAARLRSLLGGGYTEFRTTATIHNR
jgi:ATP-dependent protease Clp ATPase subunit